MSSWFYKLRRNRSAASLEATGLFVEKAATAAAGQKKPPLPPPNSPKIMPPPCSPNRASYYFPSKERALSARDNPKLRDTRFPQPTTGDIVFDVVSRRDDRFGGGVDNEAMLELKLRPIITRRADDATDDSSSAAASPAARVQRRRAETTCRRKRRWLRESVVLVKESADPEEDFLASMAEMIAANGDARSMEGLLACYLALNAAEHHGAIVAAFRRAWLGWAACRRRQNVTRIMQDASGD